MSRQRDKGLYYNWKVLKLVTIQSLRKIGLILTKCLNFEILQCEKCSDRISKIHNVLDIEPIQTLNFY
jgi:hypothetical protein